MGSKFLKSLVIIFGTSALVIFLLHSNLKVVSSEETLMPTSVGTKENEKPILCRGRPLCLPLFSEGNGVIPPSIPSPLWGEGKGEGLLFSEEISSSKKGERLLVDISIIGTLTISIALLKSDIREGILDRGSLDNIIENFKDPYNRAVEGARIDRGDHQFMINYVAHPLAYGGMGLYLKERGYRDWSAFTFTQVHNIIWEYIIEGCFVPPSGKDLITDFTSAGISIFVMDRLSRYGEKYIDEKWYYHLLYWLNPFNAINDKFFKKGPSVAFNINVTQDGLLRPLGISVIY